MIVKKNDFGQDLKKEILKEIDPEIQDLKMEIKKTIGRSLKDLLEKDLK